MKLNPRIAVVIVHDVAATTLAWLGSYWLRFNMALPGEYLSAALATLVWVVPLQSLVFWRFGLYRGLWRFASLPDLKRILLAVGVAAVLVPVCIIMFRVKAVVPRSILLLDPLLLVLIMGGSRFLYRAWKDRSLGMTMGESRPCLVLGAGATADHLLRDVSRSRSEIRVVGLLDDDPALHGRLIQGVPVLGGLEELARVVGERSVREAILAMPTATPGLRKRMLDTCDTLGIHLLTVPSLEDIVQGKVSVADLRPIELDDLLGRAPVQLDDAGLSELMAGRTVLVTGAGGSIGSELCRQIAAFRPARLVMFELNEFALYQMQQEFQSRFPELDIACLIGDVKDETRVRQVLNEHAPALVFHAAAYKHVPLMEDDNAFQCLANNVLGTWVLARESREAGVSRFVMVSTDKAVNPTNVMGASKRAAEMVCQALQAEGWGGTAFVSVRFGNVMGSSGSVIPKFRQQIEAGGPVTVTHPDITRYFMTIPEAAQLVLQAGLMGRGGEIFVLDMGEPIRIVDLARLMIRLAGKDEGDVPIRYTGLRPGEKLYEELLADSENTLPTPHAKLRIAQASQVSVEAVASLLNTVADLGKSGGGDVMAMKRQLWGWIGQTLPGQNEPLGEIPHAPEAGSATPDRGA